MAWTDQCKFEAVRHIDQHIKKGQPVRKALKLVSEESDIPTKTLERWKYPSKKTVLKNEDATKPPKQHTKPTTKTQISEVAAEIKGGGSIPSNLPPKHERLKMPKDKMQQSQQIAKHPEIGDMVYSEAAIRARYRHHKGLIDRTSKVDEIHPPPSPQTQPEQEFTDLSIQENESWPFRPTQKWKYPSGVPKTQNKPKPTKKHTKPEVKIQLLVTGFMRKRRGCWIYPRVHFKT